MSYDEDNLRRSKIRDTIKQFAQIGATMGHAERSGDLRRFIVGNKISAAISHVSRIMGTIILVAYETVDRELIDRYPRD